MPAYRSVFAGFAQLAEEVGQASRANRELFEQLVAAEVGRVAARLGIVPAAELRTARERLDAAEDELDVLRLELDDLQLRVATLEAGSSEEELPDEDVLDDELPDVELPVEDLPEVDLVVTDLTSALPADEPDLLGDETGSAGASA